MSPKSRCQSRSTWPSYLEPLQLALGLVDYRIRPCVELLDLLGNVGVAPDVLCGEPVEEHLPTVDVPAYLLRPCAELLRDLVEEFAPTCERKLVDYRVPFEDVVEYYLVG